MFQFFLLLAINILFFGIMYFLLKKEILRTVDSRKILGEIEKDIDNLMAELNRTTERDVTIIEQSSVRLKEVIAEADRRIRILNRGENAKQNEDYIALKPRQIQLSSKAFEPASEIAEPTVLETSLDQLSGKEKIMELYRQGFDAAIIARRLNLPVGEVELVISIGNV